MWEQRGEKWLEKVWCMLGMKKRFDSFLYWERELKKSVEKRVELWSAGVHLHVCCEVLYIAL